MSVQKKSMRLGYDEGQGENGKKKVKTRTYTNLATDATSEKMKAAADAISSLTLKEPIYVECITVERL